MKVALVFPPFFYPNWFWDKGEDILVPPIPSLCLYSSLMEKGIDCDVFDITALELEKIKQLESEITKSKKEVEWHNIPKLDEYFKYRLTMSTILDGKFERKYRGILDKYIKILNEGEYSHILFHVYDTTLHACIYMTDRIGVDKEVVWGGHHLPFLYYSLINPPNTNRYKVYNDKKLRKELLGEIITNWIHFLYGECDFSLPSFLTNETTDDKLDKPVMRTIHNLDSLPKLKLWKANSYTGFNTYMSRGCIFRCNFCDLNEITKQFRTRNPSTPLVEIQDSGFTKVAFSDFTVTANLKLLENFCELSNSEIQITSQATFNWSKKLTELNQEKEIIHSLAFGLETEDARLREKMNKAGVVGDDKIMQVLKGVKESKIKVCTFWLVGHPEDSFKIKKQQLKEMLKYIDYATIAIFNLGWYSSFALQGDNVTKTVEKFPEDRLVPLEEFLKFDYVFPDYPKSVIGFKYKKSEKIIQKVEEYNKIFEKELSHKCLKNIK